MKKLSLILSLVLSVIFAVSTASSSMAELITDKSYTYSEIMAMSDEELLEKSNYGMYYEFYEFENKTDEEKYMTVIPNSYYWYECFISGAETPYFALVVDESIPLDPELKSQDLGFPEGWEIKLFTGMDMMARGMKETNTVFISLRRSLTTLRIM